MIEIRQAGECIAVVPKDQVMEWFHRNKSTSMYWALEHEGYTLEARRSKSAKR